MKDKIIQKDSKPDLLLQEISVSCPGKRFLDRKTEESQSKASRVKQRKAAGRTKKAEDNQHCPEPAGGEASQKVVPPPIPPTGVENREKAAEALNEGTVAVMGEASKGGTPTTVPGWLATPIPAQAGAGKPESASDMPHILTGEEYWHFQLLKKQEANRKCKQPVGTCDGPEKTAKRSPGWHWGSHGQGVGGPL